MNRFGIEEHDLKLHHRYPNLTNWNTQQKIQKDAREPQWSCGDPKKAKRAVHRFVEKTSLHGVQYVCSRRKTTWILKLLFRFIFVICFLMLIGNEVLLLQEAFGKESTYINSINKDIKLGKQKDPEYFPDYPAVTVCRRPPYRTDFNRSYLELVEYIFLALGFPMVSFTPHELSMVIEMAVHVNDSFKLSNETLAFRDKLIELENRFQDFESQGNFNLTRFVFDHSLGKKFKYCLFLELGLVRSEVHHVLFPVMSFTPLELSLVIEMAVHVNDSFKLSNETLAFRDKLIELENGLPDFESQRNFNVTRFVFDHSLE
ncbi:hypothetical protein AVEN_142737-1 [Araneus ventricosus]|uniref:Uncharacterized protein n=1 Tax=Araneus ventricosus TaxID=182803 RepID=A0A4Y2R1C0_ARAVE|nr:hypothetical protein AVEN_269925-1 [Araneus ventricosus]GBN69459.1 hypothetical protein AVEN_142737-1 [Araneus ventricosus]